MYETNFWCMTSRILSISGIMFEEEKKAKGGKTFWLRVFRFTGHLPAFHFFSG